MKQRWYINRISFRIIYPAVAGLILYMVMLMVFGNLEMIFETFFSQEAIFMIVLAYINHEWSIFLLGRKKLSELASAPAVSPRLIYLGILLLSSVLITSSITLVYFIYILKYFHYLTEVITINVLIIIFQVIMHMYYLSMINIRKYHSLSVEKEVIQARQLELELESFKAEMNPDLLMECLENLISIMQKDVKKADAYIQGLSNQYRYLLDSRKKEFVNLKEELEALQELLFLLNGGGEDRILLELSAGFSGKDQSEKPIIPGTLLNLAFNIENSMILNSLDPLKIQLFEEEDGGLSICIANRPRLIPGKTISIEKLEQSYEYYTGKNLERKETDNQVCWSIPPLPEISDI